MSRIYVTNYSPEYLDFLRRWRKCLKKNRDTPLPVMRNPFVREVASTVERTPSDSTATSGEAKP